MSEEMDAGTKAVLSAMADAVKRAEAEFDATDDGNGGLSSYPGGKPRRIEPYEVRCHAVRITQELCRSSYVENLQTPGPITIGATPPIDMDKFLRDAQRLYLFLLGGKL